MSSIATGAPVWIERPGAENRSAPKLTWSDHAGLPADAGLDQEIAPIGAIAQDLNMLDVGDAGNLGGGVLQQARNGGRFIDDAREHGERALIAQSFLWIEHEAPLTGR